MILSKNNLQSRVSYLTKLTARTEDALRSAPEGRLILSSCRGKRQYMRKSSDKMNKRTYMSRSENELVLALAQKDYDEQILDAARGEIAALTSLIHKYELGTAEDVFDKLSPERQELVTPFILPDDVFIQNWLDKPYDSPGFAEGEPVILNSKGLRVRSKSESGISDKYDARGIPYRYEEPLFLEGYGWVNPDFRLLNVRYRKEIIHEHLGKMDDPLYADDNVAKIIAYQSNGYILGKNLLITMETRNHPFNTRDIDLLIYNYLV